MGASSPQFSLYPQVFIGELGLAQNKFLDPPVMGRPVCLYSIQGNMLAYLQYEEAVSLFAILGNVSVYLEIGIAVKFQAKQTCIKKSGQKWNIQSCE